MLKDEHHVGWSMVSLWVTVLSAPIQTPNKQNFWVKHFYSISVCVPLREVFRPGPKAKTALTNKVFVHYPARSSMVYVPAMEPRILPSLRWAPKITSAGPQDAKTTWTTGRTKDSLPTTY